MSDQVSLTPNQVDEILSTPAIRAKAKDVFALCENGGTAFRYHPEKLQPTIDYVLSVIRKNYPSLEIPFHSRWGHFRAGGIDRVAKLDQMIKGQDPIERARIKLDLVITSVLLDAGAGMQWGYLEDGKRYSRSEGLGVASYHMFLAGAMASDRKSLRADKQGLMAVKVGDIQKAFQVSDKNPLVGAEGRTLLLNSLGRAVGDTTIFPKERPGSILDSLIKAHGQTIPATALLRAVLDGLGPIWPKRLSANGKNLGDVWRHSKLGLVPFHKLSQWMTYSLIEPIVEAGIKVTGVQNLTGLAEYRNGGLLVDSGLVSLRDEKDAAKTWAPGSDLIIEWRALTVHLLDVIGEGVRKSLGKTPEDFPLAKVLEGGTWWAGRFLATEKREDGGPPLKIESDGTVF